jgi:uncharacterized protein YacL (UPF0231 family)
MNKLTARDTPDYELQMLARVLTQINNFIENIKKHKAELNELYTLFNKLEEKEYLLDTNLLAIDYEREPVLVSMRYFDKDKVILYYKEDYCNYLTVENCSYLTRGFNIDCPSLLHLTFGTTLCTLKNNIVYTLLYGKSYDYSIARVYDLENIVNNIDIINRIIDNDNCPYMQLISLRLKSTDEYKKYKDLIAT